MRLHFALNYLFLLFFYVARHLLDPLHFFSELKMLCFSLRRECFLYFAKLLLRLFPEFSRLGESSLLVVFGDFFLLLLVCHFLKNLIYFLSDFPCWFVLIRVLRLQARGEEGEMRKTPLRTITASETSRDENFQQNFKTTI